MTTNIEQLRVHIGKVAAICFFHLHRLRQLRFILTSSSMQRLVSALTISRIDYCNSVLYDLLDITLAPLHSSACRCTFGSESCLSWSYDASNERASLATNRLPHQRQIMSHDARGSNQQKPAISYQYTRPDIISVSPWATSFARVRRFQSTPCTDRV